MNGTAQGSHLHRILLQQREAVAAVLRSSQEFLNRQEDFSVERFEQLIKHRAEQVQLIERLEDERRQIMEQVDGLDATLQPIQADIQECLSALAALDDCLKDVVFKRQLQLINNMAFTPKFVNFSGNAPEERRAASRVVDIMR